MSDLARRIEQLPQEKRALLEQRLLQQRSNAALDSIPRRDRTTPCPLSFPQQRLWFLDQWSPGSHVYNAALPMLIRGDLDVEALRAAFEQVVARHEAVRTVFRTEDGTPVQVPLTSWTLEFPLVDLRNLPESSRREELERLLREHARRAFDLANDVMLRATLIRIGDEESVLLIQEHHIAFDGWSDGVLFQELHEAYGALLEGRKPELQDLLIQYGDFTVWQLQRLSGAFLDTQLDYWRRQLAGAPSLINLPTDRPRPAIQRFEGAHHPIALRAELADGVRRLSRQQGITPFMTLLGAFATLLYRWTGDDDILVGSPIANRGRMELEPLIGFFSNTLVLRTRLAGNPTFRELLARVRETALGAYAHQDLPFEKVVEAMSPQRDARVNPLFQVNFRVQSGPPTTLELPGLTISTLDVDVGFSRFDLALELQLREEGVKGYLEYNTELFEPATAVRLSQEFERLLESVLEDPDTPLLSLPVFAEDGGPDASARKRPAIKKFRDHVNVVPESSPSA